MIVAPKSKTLTEEKKLQPNSTVDLSKVPELLPFLVRERLNESSVFYS